MYQAVFDRAIMIIAIYFFRALLTTLLILVILNKLVVRDIVGLTKYFGNLKNIDDLKGYTTQREKRLFKKRDEIDTLVSEINNMGKDLRKEYETKLQAQKELVELNEALEKEIESRVQEIRVKDKQLSVQESYKVMNELAGHVAHELNNPLAIIKGYLEIVDMKIDSGDMKNVRNYFNKAFWALERVTKVSKSLTNLVTFDSKITGQKSNVADTIEEAAIFLESFLESVNIEFSFDTTNTDTIPTIRSKALGGQILVALTKDLVTKIKRTGFNPRLHLKAFIENGKLVAEFVGEGLELPEIYDQSFDFKTAMDESMSLWFAQNTLEQINAVLHYYSNQKCF